MMRLRCRRRLMLDMPYARLRRAAVDAAYVDIAVVLPYAYLIFWLPVFCSCRHVAAVWYRHAERCRFSPYMPPRRRHFAPMLCSRHVEFAMSVLLIRDGYATFDARYASARCFITLFYYYACFTRCLMLIEALIWYAAPPAFFSICRFSDIPLFCRHPLPYARARCREPLFATLDIPIYWWWLMPAFCLSYALSFFTCLRLLLRFSLPTRYYADCPMFSRSEICCFFSLLLSPHASLLFRHTCLLSPRYFDILKSAALLLMLIDTYWCSRWCARLLFFPFDVFWCSDIYTLWCHYCWCFVYLARKLPAVAPDAIAARLLPCHADIDMFIIIAVFAMFWCCLSPILFYAPPLMLFRCRYMRVYFAWWCLMFDAMPCCRYVDFFFFMFAYFDANIFTYLPTLATPTRYYSMLIIWFFAFFIRSYDMLMMLPRLRAIDSRVMPYTDALLLMFIDFISMLWYDGYFSIRRCW